MAKIVDENDVSDNQALKNEDDFEESITPYKEMKSMWNTISYDDFCSS